MSTDPNIAATEHRNCSDTSSNRVESSLQQGECNDNVTNTPTTPPTNSQLPTTTGETVDDSKPCTSADANMGDMDEHMRTTSKMMSDNDKEAKIDANSSDDIMVSNKDSLQSDANVPFIKTQLNDDQQTIVTINNKNTDQSLKEEHVEITSQNNKNDSNDADPMATTAVLSVNNQNSNVSCLDSPTVQNDIRNDSANRLLNPSISDADMIDASTNSTTQLTDDQSKTSVDYSSKSSTSDVDMTDVSMTDHAKVTADQPKNCPISPITSSNSGHPACQFRTDKNWLNLQFHDKGQLSIKKPDEIEDEMNEPTDKIDSEILNRIQGSIIGMALGDALGAHVEFRPHQFLVERPVTDLESGGTWGLKKGQFTDDTSMALCLANSLIARRDFIPYDQLVRYKWWHEFGYMSSTGQCFDIGAATSQSLREFEKRQKLFATQSNIPIKYIDCLSNHELLNQFNVYCSEDQVAGNGALMRLAPVPLFFYRIPDRAVEYSGCSGQITHGDKKAYDACRYYGALIVAALRGYTKEQLLDDDFYVKHKKWFNDKELHPDIDSISKGSYKKNGYQAGIRGKGYIVKALEAALWAFWSDNNSFTKGVLAAVNLGDDTDTTAAIYGQLAGAYYGYQELPERWLKHVYAKKFMEKLSKWIAYEGECWQKRYESSISPSLTSNI
ncbi:unnamed protein product [Rotaria sordida]|uniref:ADP-ribosylglycohydrolase n=1 Tax=Rotaria sordida TaxID=392033 RepID=A0A814VSU2_9BILA|nr:unnamed protein product [Rotaria sordida]